MSGNVGEVPHIFLFSSVVKSELEIVVESELDALGFDLVDLGRQGSRARPVIEVRIDRRDGERVTVEDCARVSRAIEQALDARGAALVGDRYELQVSSPGADRPLKSERDWRRFVGRRALVKSAALGGRKEVEIVEVNGTGDDVVVTLRDADRASATPRATRRPSQESARGETGDAREYRVPLKTIDEARLTFNWDRGVTDGRFR
jgi:ribosome maturation factor RimP